METLTLRTRFIVRGANEYQVSGNPGVGICPMLGGDGTDNGDFARYAEIASTDTSATVPAHCPVKTLRRETIRSLCIDTERALPYVTRTLFLTDARRLLLRADDDLLLSDVLACFDEGGSPLACVMLSKLAGEVLAGEARSLRFFIRPNEQGHNVPHVHVDYRHEQSASMSLIDGRVLCGRLPRRMERAARRVIIDKQEDLLRYWNENTNGIHRDLNVWLGTTPIVDA